MLGTGARRISSRCALTFSQLASIMMQSLRVYVDLHVGAFRSRGKSLRRSSAKSLQHVRFALRALRALRAASPRSTARRATPRTPRAQDTPRCVRPPELPKRVHLASVRSPRSRADPVQSREFSDMRRNARARRQLHAYIIANAIASVIVCHVMYGRKSCMSLYSAHSADFHAV